MNYLDSHRITFGFSHSVSGSQWRVTADTLQGSCTIMTSQSQLVCENSAYWLNNQARGLKDIDIVRELIRINKGHYTDAGLLMIEHIAHAAGVRYNKDDHTLSHLGEKIGGFMDEGDDQDDSFGIGKPGRRSTKGWEPDVPDPSVDLMKSIKDVCDRSRL